MKANYSNPLPGVPNVESPFFDEMFDPADPHYQVAVDLRKNGFAVIDFPEPDFERLAAEIKRSLNDSYAWQVWREHNADLRVMDAEVEAVRKIATNAGILDLLSYLYGRPAFPFQTLNFPVGTQQHFHSDSVHFSSRPERFMCGVWVALEDVGPDQGPLLYYRGSHQWPIYTHEHIGHTHKRGYGQGVFEPMWERLVEKKNARAERFMPKKGQALIWAANLLHGGDIHLDKSRTRWSQVTHYFFDDCVYYTPLLSNEPLSEIYHRRPVDMVTGQMRESSYNGRRVPERFMRATARFDGVKRRLGKLLRAAKLR